LDNIARIVMAVFGVLMLAGGIGGYAKAHSTGSLMAGIGSGLAMAVAWYVSRQQPKTGFIIGAVVAAVLVAVFIHRIQELLAKTPPGSIGMNIGLCSLSAITALFLLYACLQSRP
jgi:uncharacterized membrane protein (UPF0136 family)